jgi:protein-S-isoprenylcysteine O-methyltransferase Ste14
MPISNSTFGHPRRYIRHMTVTAVWIALCFAGAGRFDWKRGWICAAIYVAGTSATGLVVLVFNPGLIEARAQWKHEDTRGFDRRFMSIFFPLTLVQPLAAGLDAARFRSLPMPQWTIVAGAALYLLSMAIICSALLANPFAETTVRLQSERGHRVARGGSYRVVRHPMYVGMMLLYPSLALLFGSGWAMVVAVVIDTLIVWRTSQEDRFLRQELAGYSEYAGQTRFRLVPGLW